MQDMYIEIAARLKDLREIMDYSIEEMAKLTDVTPEEYQVLESGSSDFGFTFLYKAAKALRVDITDLVAGESPRLSTFTVVRNGEGFPIKRRSGFNYQHLAYLFKNKKMEPFVVQVPYEEEAMSKPIPLSTHKGQELDYILEGELKTVVDSHETVLKKGDCIYYDSSKPHGMIANNPEGVTFLAIVTAGDAE